MSPKARSSPADDRRDRLTLAKLASYDDVATDALVDRAYFWTNIRKNRTKYIALRGVSEDSVAHTLLHDIIVEKDVAKAERTLLRMSGLKRYLAKLPNDREKEWFRRHLRKYIQMYLPDSPFEVTTTNRYTIIEHEAAICARRFIKQGQEIKYLSGTLVPMTREEEQELDLKRKDFSIVMSSRRKTPSFFLGPARFANHDCNANGRLVTRGSEGMQVVATRDIYIGEEITVSYGEDYFGIDNCECLCLSCERAVRNGWAPVVDSDQPSQASTPAAAEGSLTPRKRKRAPDSDVDTSPSTPRKRGAFVRQTSKLRSEVSQAEVDFVELAQENSLSLADHTRLTPPAPSEAAEAAGDPAGPETKEGENPRPHHGTDCESPPSVTADDSQRSSASTAPTSVCDGGVTAKVEETIETTVHENPSIPPNEVAQTVSALSGSTHNDHDVLSDLSEPLELDEKLGTMTERVGTPRRKSCGKNGVVPSVEAESHGTRVPGDYTKTSRLLAQTYDRWVDCHTCNVWFVQHNSYLTRRECPRCERHSMLYGFRWPKTDPEGNNDDEERVMDHRTVHRFLYPEEESRVSRKDRGVSFGVTPTPELSDARAETDDGEAPADRRNTRASRTRTRALRMTM
ncbi:SET domain-containing protein [Aspergillus candidus]|uniref:Histone-lysine N-methyltransferase SET9 n=1 Tax=Aspergillus candidus TaxID=41067 RepID=A0A2I2EZX5_ASPCN|nr:SET domain protein [Aspergillus candidus]PLB33935.1 SET domain protein [Aspergillus candidus]